MTDKKLSPAMIVAAILIGLGIAFIVFAAATGSDLALLGGPLCFIGAGAMAYRVRLEQAEMTKPPQSGVIDPSKFRP